MIVLALIAGFLTLGFSLVLEYRKMSTQIMRASEISAVLNLLSGHLRRDAALKDAIKASDIEDYVAGLSSRLNDHIESSGFQETELSSISVERITQETDLYRVEVVVRDLKTGREERSYVAISLY